MEKLQYLLKKMEWLVWVSITRIWINKDHQILISSLYPGNLKWNILLFQLFMKNFTLLILKTLNLLIKQKKKGKHKNQQAYIYHSSAVSKLQWIFSCGEISHFLTHTKDLKSKNGRNPLNLKNNNTNDHISTIGFKR